MNAILDELRVGEDGTIYVGVVPLGGALARPNILATFPHSTPMCEFVGSLLKRIAAQIDIGCAIEGIVHGGDDRFTVITSDGDYLAVDAKVSQSAIAQIQDIAQLILAVERLNERITSPIPMGRIAHLSSPPINRMCPVPHAGNRFYNRNWPEVWSLEYNVHLPRKVSRYTYEEPNRLVRSAQ